MEAIGEASGMALWLDTDINIQVVETYLPGFQALLTGSKQPEELMAEVHQSAVEAQATVTEE